MASQPQPRRKREQTLWSGHPTWKGMLGFYFKWQGIALTISALAGFAWYTGHFAFAKLALLVVVLNGFPLGLGKLIRTSTSYTITNKRVSESKGILRKTLEEAPIARIDNVTVNQSLLERILNVGTVDFDTAGEKSGDILIWRGIADPHNVRRKIEYVQGGFEDESDYEHGEESSYLKPDARYADNGYIEDERPSEPPQRPRRYDATGAAEDEA